MPAPVDDAIGWLAWDIVVDRCGRLGKAALAAMRLAQSAAASGPGAIAALIVRPISSSRVRREV